MEVFSLLSQHEHEEVLFCYDKKTQLKAIIAIHSTKLGPALGGTRLLAYSSEEEAYHDVLKLSRGMSYKNAAAGLPLGGGKAVIICDPKHKTPALLETYGHFVNSLGGTYITAADMNTSEEDMVHIHKKTNHVAGLPQSQNSSGDPSPFTALGTYEGIKACIKHRLDTTQLNDIQVAIQGLGSVGLDLCSLLHQAGAKLVVADVNSEKTALAQTQFDAKVVATEDIHKQAVDVFSPCARGGIINDGSINELNCRIIAGAANNQLSDEHSMSEALRRKNILYAPDYIINAGGVINISYEINQSYNQAAAKEKVKDIYNTLLKIFVAADKHQTSTLEAANKLAEMRLQSE